MSTLSGSSRAVWRRFSPKGNSTMTDKPNNDQPSDLTWPRAAASSSIRSSPPAGRPVRRHVPGHAFGRLGCGRRRGNQQGWLGFIALTDAAPLFVAAEKGFFAKYGMTEVEVLAVFLGTTRDNLGARLGEEWHRWRAHPHAHALPDQCRHRHAEQPAGAHVDPRAAQPAGQCISVGEEYRDLKIGSTARRSRRR